MTSQTLTLPEGTTLDRLGSCEFAQLPLGTEVSWLPAPEVVQGAVMVDCETSGLHPDDGARVSVVSAAFPAPSSYSAVFEGLPVVPGAPKYHEEPRRYISVAFAFGQGPDEDRYCATKTDWNRLMTWLQQAGSGLVGHNLRFDLQQLAGRAVPGWRGRDLVERAQYDTMVAQFELEPQKRLALKEIAKSLWGEDQDAEQQALKPYLGRKSDPRFDLVPWEVMYPYARRDVELTAALFEHQQDLFDENTMAGGFVDMEMGVLRALARMELAGLPYDPEASLEAAHQLDEEIARLATDLPFKPTPVGSRNYFFGPPEQGGLGLEATERTATGAPSASAAVVKRLAAQEVPHAETLLEYNRLKSANSKWFYPFAQRAGADRRIRTSFRHTGGTKSGRFSASRINLQAVPKDYSLHLPVATPRQLVAREVQQRYPGWQLWECDLMQAELRLAAMDADCEPMLDALREGRDAHGETATQLFGVEPGDEQWSFYRSIAKRANFSLIFGSGPQTFQTMLRDQAGVDLPFAQVRQIVYDWRDLYPQFGAAIERNMAFCETTGFVPLIGGRKRWYAPGEDKHSSFNQRIQGSLAFFAKLWTLDTDRRLRWLVDYGRQQGVGRAGLVLTVHDSQVLLLPEGQVEELIQSVTDSARELWADLFPAVPGGADAERWA